MASVSVPEKTLEHWASLYLTYRYRSHASMWWPAKGVDIDVQRLPAQPGKAVQFELKSTVVSGVNYQDVVVNLGQLWDYYRLPLAMQPYYVFPWPNWAGDLGSAALAAGITPTELAFRRSGPGWWFADWMVVLTTAQVAGVLSGELAAHGSSVRKGASCRLVRFDLSAGSSAPVRTWGASAGEPPTVSWRQFWTDLQACGRNGWPQLIRLPADLVRKTSYSRAEIRGLLASSLLYIGESRNRQLEFITLGPSGDISANRRDIFVGISSERVQVDPSPDDVVLAEDADHCQAVFVNAGARRDRG